MTPSERLRALNLELPGVASPVGSYLPATRAGDNIHTSGQLPMRDGQLTHTGKVPNDVSVEDAAQATAQAMLNALAAAAQAAGGIDNILRVIKVSVYVNSSEGFTQQPRVANGASDLLVEVFGDAGKHARAAVGVAELPLDAVVEVDLLVEAASP